MEEVISLSLSVYHKRIQKEDGHLQTGSIPSTDTRSVGALISDLQPPELWEKNVYCISPTGYEILVQQPKLTKMTSDFSDFPIRLPAVTHTHTHVCTCVCTHTHTEPEGWCLTGTEL